MVLEIHELWVLNEFQVDMLEKKVLSSGIWWHFEFIRENRKGQKI
jgi:hypothetical protein